MSQIVQAYYDNHADREWSRLENPYSRVEWLSTLRLMDRYFPDTGHICDIGSGPGRYAIELLQQGYQVTLMDLSSNELALAQKRIEGLGLQAEAYLCESAVNMDVLNDQCCDGVLALGPLYHLLKEEERSQAIRHVYRILKPGGVALLAYINSWGVLKSGVSEFSESYRDPEEIYKYLQEQQLDENEGFTSCYFTIPIKAIEEVKAGGFEIMTYAGTESFLAGMREEVSRLYIEDPVVYENLMQAASETSEAPQYRDATEHMVIVVRRPENSEFGG